MIQLQILGALHCCLGMRMQRGPAMTLKLVVRFLVNRKMGKQMTKHNIMIISLITTIATATATLSTLCYVLRATYCVLGTRY